MTLIQLCNEKLSVTIYFANTDSGTSWAIVKLKKKQNQKHPKKQNKKTTKQKNSPEKILQF